MMPPIDWPVVQVGKHRLIMRWTFYAKWLLSQRKVDMRNFAQNSPEVIANSIDIFAAMVAENFTAIGQEPPTAAYWAMAISDNGGDALWAEVVKAISETFGKVKPAAAPAPQETATPTGVN